LKNDLEPYDGRLSSSFAERTDRSQIDTYINQSAQITRTDEYSDDCLILIRLKVRQGLFWCSRKRVWCEMAIPITVPIANTTALADNKKRPASTESVAAILTRCKTSLIEAWLVRTKKTPQLNHLHLRDDERTGHLPQLIDDLVIRLGRPKLPDKDSDAIASAAAIEHGKLRRMQGYSSAMLIHESRILQVTIFGTLHENLSTLDFNLLLPDVMIIADEVDAQLTQTMDAFATPGPKLAVA
jgi:hypothetical protein